MNDGNEQGDAPRSKKNQEFLSEFAALVELVEKDVKDEPKEEKEEFVKSLNVKAPTKRMKKAEVTSPWARAKKRLGIDFELSAPVVISMVLLLLMGGFAGAIHIRDSYYPDLSKNASALAAGGNESLNALEVIAKTGGGYKSNAAAAEKPAEPAPTEVEASDVQGGLVVFAEPSYLEQSVSFEPVARERSSENAKKREPRLASPHIPPGLEPWQHAYLALMS